MILIVHIFKNNIFCSLIVNSVLHFHLAGLLVFLVSGNGVMAFVGVGQVRYHANIIAGLKTAERCPKGFLGDAFSYRFRHNLENIYVQQQTLLEWVQVIPINPF